ncbi:MAG: aquaporin [Candidatus Levybacteria bacterium]|nr:aquaporin [Candidatus Levybacteria bacterium]
MNKYIIEGIGAFFLVLTIGFSANPLAIGFVLAAMVYMGGYISGGHYNPAVTLAIFIQKKISQRDAGMYMLFQLLGAIAASLIFLLIKQEPLVVAPGSSVTFNEALLLEALFTFALCSVVLHTAVSKKNTPNQFYGLAIGSTVMVGAYSVGSISGGAFNPAVGVSPAIVSMISNTPNLSNVLLYILGPFIGGVLASLVFTSVTKSEK